MRDSSDGTAVAVPDGASVVFVSIRTASTFVAEMSKQNV
jgi:hypothetical protein